MTDTVGFIGLGVMGRPMARNLLKRAFPLVVHSRSQGPVDELVSAGATAAPIPGRRRARRPRASSRCCPMVPTSRRCSRAVGRLRRRASRHVIVDMSTISPAHGAPSGGGGAPAGGSMLDAPVSGGEIGAIDGTLSIMVGGDAAALDARAARARSDGQPRTHHPRRRIRRRADLQGLQPARDRRHARRRRRGVCAGEDQASIRRRSARR